MAIDVGKARIGVAISDFHAILASPLITVKRQVDLESTILDLVNAVDGFEELLEIYVGSPVNLKGQSTFSTQDALDFAAALQSKTTIPVLLVDERLTTSLANSQLRAIGKSQKAARSTIDQMAAVAILEYALSVENTSDKVPGISLEDWRAND